MPRSGGRCKAIGSAPSHPPAAFLCPPQFPTRVGPFPEPSKWRADATRNSLQKVMNSLQKQSNEKTSSPATLLAHLCQPIVATNIDACEPTKTGINGTLKAFGDSTPTNLTSEVTIGVDLFLITLLDQKCCNVRPKWMQGVVVRWWMGWRK